MYQEAAVSALHTLNHGLTSKKEKRKKSHKKAVLQVRDSLEHSSPSAYASEEFVCISLHNY